MTNASDLNITCAFTTHLGRSLTFPDFLHRVEGELIKKGHFVSLFMSLQLRLQFLHLRILLVDQLLGHACGRAFVGA